MKKCHILGRGSLRLGLPGHLLLVLAAGDDCVVDDNTDDSSVDAGVDTGNVDARGVDTGVDTRGVDTGMDTRGVDTGVDTGCVNVGCVNVGSVDLGSVDLGSVDSGSLDDDNVVTSSESTQLMSLIAKERSKLGALVAFTHHERATMTIASPLDPPHINNPQSTSAGTVFTKESPLRHSSCIAIHQRFHVAPYSNGLSMCGRRVTDFLRLIHQLTSSG